MTHKRKNEKALSVETAPNEPVKDAQTSSSQNRSNTKDLSTLNRPVDTNESSSKASKKLKIFSKESKNPSVVPEESQKNQKEQKKPKEFLHPSQHQFNILNQRSFKSKRKLKNLKMRNPMSRNLMNRKRK
jgi:hypothetical protein